MSGASFGFGDGTTGFGTGLLKDVLARQFLYLDHVHEPDGRCRIGIPLPAEVQDIAD